MCVAIVAEGERKFLYSSTQMDLDLGQFSSVVALLVMLGGDMKFSVVFQIQRFSKGALHQVETALGPFNRPLQ